MNIYSNRDNWLRRLTIAGRLQLVHPVQVTQGVEGAAQKIRAEEWEKVACVCDCVCVCACVRAQFMCACTKHTGYRGGCRVGGIVEWVSLSGLRVCV